MNKKITFILFSVFTIISLITGCSSRYISTNVDKKNFDEYFSAAEVKIYTSEQSITDHYQFIDAVEGQDCQEKAHHAAPDEINARTQARRQAFEKQANGVVFTGCALLSPERLAQLNRSNDAQQCHAIVICYAKAFAIKPTANQ